jgi:DNA primase
MVFDPIEEIKQRLDIVDVVSEYVKLQKSGANYRALCPFHKEKNPSFFVSPSKQIFKCFGCGKGGNIFDFIMEIEGVEFGDALKILARKAGIDLKPYRKELAEFKTERALIYEICELATRFFQKQLRETKTGQEVIDYLLKRGISKESIEKWRLGWAPDNWRGLSNFLISKGYKREDIIKAGLAIAKDVRENSRESDNPQNIISGSLQDIYDRFRGRIIFPIFDLNSQVVGFGGRIFKENKDEETAKYINTPNTILYDKSRILYGLNFAKVDIKRKDFCILVEGYTDVILSHQAGFENTVAASGTSLTLFQLNTLKRYTNNLYTAFDMDIGGDSATQRGILLAQGNDFSVKVVVMPQDKDPADVISESPKDWELAINSAKDVMEFYFENAFLKFDKTKVEGKKEIAKFLLPKIKAIKNEIIKSHWVRKLAKELEVKEEAILEELKNIKLEEIPKEENFQDLTFEKLGIESTEKDRKAILEERILGIILKFPEMIDYLDKDFQDFISPQGCKILDLISKIEEKDKIFSNQFLKENNLDITKEKLGEYILQIEILFENAEAKEIKEEFLNSQKNLKRICFKEKMEEIIKEIQEKEKEGERENIENLAKKLDEISKKINQL